MQQLYDRQFFCDHNSAQFQYASIATFAKSQRRKASDTESRKEKFMLYVRVRVYFFLSDRVSKFSLADRATNETSVIVNWNSDQRVPSIRFGTEPILRVWKSAFGRSDWHLLRSILDGSSESCAQDLFLRIGDIWVCSHVTEAKRVTKTNKQNTTKVKRRDYQKKTNITKNSHILFEHTRIVMRSYVCWILFGWPKSIEKQQNTNAKPKEIKSNEPNKPSVIILQ